MFFALFGHLMGSKSIEKKNVFGLTASKNIGKDTLLTYLSQKMAEW